MDGKLRLVNNFCATLVPVPYLNFAGIPQKCILESTLMRSWLCFIINYCWFVIMYYITATQQDIFLTCVYMYVCVWCACVDRQMDITNLVIKLAVAGISFDGTSH